MSSSADTSDGMVTPSGASSNTPPDGAGDEPVLVGPQPPPFPFRDAPARRRFRRRTWFLGFLALALVGFIVSASVVKLDYFAFKPGSVRNTSGLIVVEGIETYPADGTISYTTVSLRRVTLFELAQGWLDPDIDIHPEEDVLQGRDSEENRQVNLQLMDTSQEFATQVALERLGYDVPISITGQMVTEVQDGFPAEGVMEAGDTIVAIDGERIDDPTDLQRLLDDEHPGDDVAITVLPLSGTGEEEVELTLAASPEDVEQGVMGVIVQPTGMDFDFPIEASFDTGAVGGPSAGLAFTLGLIDLLTPGELTGGVSVAVTGTIEPDGSVGPIGGAGQKAAAAREAGVEVFLVPSADYESAVARAGDVEVIRVDTLDDALEALAEYGGNGLDLPNLAEQQAEGNDSTE